jgi:hypothetical protein
MKTHSKLHLPTESDSARRTLSESDTRRVFALLKNPPAANDRLVRAARAGFVLPLAADADALKRGIEPEFCT